MLAPYDLHIHSCLSPCGSDDMTPNNLVNMAALLGYDLIAVTDHNACGNAAAVLQAAGRVIRTPEDRGVVLLIDDRFAAPAYRRLMPPHWDRLTPVYTLDALRRALGEFWGNEE